MFARRWRWARPRPSSSPTPSSPVPMRSSTAKVLAAAAKRLGDADLIITGTESSDGYTGTVPEQIAEVLGLPSVTFAKSVKVDGGVLKVNRQTEAGYDEVECTLPAVVSVTAGVVEPRYPSFKGIMAAKSKPVDTVTAADLGVHAGRLGRRRPADRRRRRGARAGGRRDRRGRRRSVQQDRRVPRQPQGHLRRTSNDMAISNIWVFAQGARRAPPTSTTLELLTKARCSPAADRAPSRRSCRATRRTSPARSASTAPPRSTPRATSAVRCRAPRWRRRSRPSSTAATHPTSSCSRRTTWAATSSAACRSSSTVRCSRTTPTSLSTATPCKATTPVFGGTKLVTTTFTGQAPYLVAVRPKSFAAESAGGAAPEVVAAPVPDARCDRRRQGRAGARRGALRPEARRGQHRRVRRPRSRRGRQVRAHRDAGQAAQGCAGRVPCASSTPVGCPTATRSARPARSSSPPSTSPPASPAPRSTWWA